MPPTPQKKRDPLRTLFLSLLVVGATVGALIVVLSPPQAEAPDPQFSQPLPVVPTPALATASDWLACRANHQLAKDIEAGVLTDAELRERVKAIYEQAQVTPDTNVAKRSAELLRGLTAGGDLDDNARLWRELIRACAAAVGRRE
jgi:hypothetical protein